jgi:hypothetical protein
MSTTYSKSPTGDVSHLLPNIAQGRHNSLPHKLMLGTGQCPYKFTSTRTPPPYASSATFIRGRKLLAGQYFSSGVASGLDAPMPLKLSTQQLNVHGNELHLGERVVTWQ